MDLVSLNAFFKQHPNLEEEKPGLYKFLADIYWRDQYSVSLDEAEHLAKITFMGPSNADPHIWARELERYQGQRR